MIKNQGIRFLLTKLYYANYLITDNLYVIFRFQCIPFKRVIKYNRCRQVIHK
jgi:hypothetical protein